MLVLDQRSTLAGIQATNRPLYRAYLLKEQLRAVFQARDLAAARRLLTGWIPWAQRCRLPAFVKLAKTIQKYQQLILSAVEHGLSNTRSEATNRVLRDPAFSHQPRHLVYRRSEGAPGATEMSSQPEAPGDAANDDESRDDVEHNGSSTPAWAGGGGWTSAG